jgi:hypothetical protein
VFVFVSRLVGFTSAQDVPPPPKPQDNRPTLEETMKFIGSKLGEIGTVNEVAYVHDNVDGRDITIKMSWEYNKVRVSADKCRIDNVLGGKDFGFPLKDVQEIVVEPEDQAIKRFYTADGHPEWTIRIDPSVYSLTVKLPKKLESRFQFYDESLANRVAKAMLHAVELCGGGKEPF